MAESKVWRAHLYDAKGHTHSLMFKATTSKHAMRRVLESMEDEEGERIVTIEVTRVEE